MIVQPLAATGGIVAASCFRCMEAKGNEEMASSASHYITNPTPTHNGNAPLWDTPAMMSCRHLLCGLAHKVCVPLHPKQV
ncbi:hypothetical protein GDO78_023216 [Eleutherodactylus coqui]|uniref:Uncharacterized protein n=1 Tax=Eleutherodactylus coqui TaxID=57060 RepID=A0A8J6BD64_ELECQ|nr:hypothetical protein GDO78_023216 [Eleutherodactylus coqui]